MYSDEEFLAVLVKELLKGTLSQEELFGQGRRYCNVQKIIGPEKNCWLCEELFQKSYLKKMGQLTLQQIQDQKYTIYQKYKLNIKVPLIFTLKYFFFCMYLWNLFKKTNNSHQQLNIDKNENTQKQQQQSQKISPIPDVSTTLTPYLVDSQAQLLTIQNILKTPYDKLNPKLTCNPILEMKVIQKWLISYEFNSNTSLQSTIEELDDMLTINIEHDYHNQKLENNLMQVFNHLLGLEKKHTPKGKYWEKSKPSKKVKIDLGCIDKQQKIEEDEGNGNINPIQGKKELDVNVKNQEFKCVANNVNKILYLKYEDIERILNKIAGKDNFMKFLEPLEQPPKAKANTVFVNSLNSISRTIKLQTKHIYFCGKYCKYSRFISQTPWLINDKKITQGSLSEEIEDRIVHYFFPDIPRQKIQTKFHSGGRQDIDVRMLKGGRPFVLELVNPIVRLSDLTLEKVASQALISKDISQQILDSMKQMQNSITQKENNTQSPSQFFPKTQAQKITYFLQQTVNLSTQLVQIKEFKPTTDSYISNQLKKAESQKIKHYVCYVVCQEQFSQQDKLYLQSLSNIEINQKTPLRVMHRRTSMTRLKMIHKIYLHKVSKYSAVVELWGSAGTYIKEFIHGDLNRTMPNIGSLLKKKCDILQLDVGSLKEGNWQQGDAQKMRLEKFDWMKEEEDSEQKQTLQQKL